MLKVNTEDNLADIGTKGHDKDKLRHLIALNSLIRLNVENYCETIAAGATITSASAAPSSSDARTALTAIAIAAEAFLPLAEARVQISVTAAEHPNALMIMLACALVPSSVLNVFQGYDAHHRRPRRSTGESAGLSVGMIVGVQSQCTYTRWTKNPRLRHRSEFMSLERPRATYELASTELLLMLWSRALVPKARERWRRVALRQYTCAPQLDIRLEIQYLSK